MPLSTTSAEPGGSVRELSLLLADSTALVAERLATIGLEVTRTRADRGQGAGRTDGDGEAEA